MLRMLFVKIKAIKELIFKAIANLSNASTIAQIVDYICDEKEATISDYTITNESNCVVVEKGTAWMKVYTQVNLYCTNSVELAPIVKSLENLGYSKATRLDYEVYGL